jgi:glycosyltransferase involved in cell wall biosynthesis
MTGKKSLSILMIGPLPPPIHGDSRMFSFLLEDLSKRQDFAVSVINTRRLDSGRSFYGNVRAALIITFKILFQIRQLDIISFHSSIRGMCLYGPVAFIISRLFRRPLIIRFFGGYFDEYYTSRRPLIRWILKHTILSSDIILFQTKHLINFFVKESPSRVEWFSNYTRRVQKRPDAPVQGVCKKFVYLGHLWKTKGIEIILNSVNDLPEDVTIDLYGTLDDYSAEEITQRGGTRVIYKGTLTQPEVMEKLWDYDALVLPTSHTGEGYPGVIVEAFSHSLPVITTKWKSIPEIVDESCGILITPGDVQQFSDAVRKLHDDRPFYESLSIEAKKRADNFSDIYWTEKFVNLCKSLIKT